MHVLKTNFQNNPNIGLFGFATDSYCLLPKNLNTELVKKIKQVLSVPIYQINIYNTNLIGIFCTGNEDFLFVPEILPREELKELEKIKEAKLIILPTKHTALGNNLLINKNNCLVNPNLEKKALNKLQDLGFKVSTTKIADTSTIGSCATITNKGCLLHRDSTSTNLKQIETFFKLATDIGTVNLGNPYIKSGILANSHGYITGLETTGPEIQRIDETLGFLKTK